MMIAQVKGTIVSTKKDNALIGSRLLIVQQSDSHGTPNGPDLVAVDTFGAGAGDFVLLATGSSARALFDNPKAPVDLVIIGIIDSMEKSR